MPLDPLPICDVCGDNSGWIADSAYGWVQCANCNDERMKPKPEAEICFECQGPIEPNDRKLLLDKDTGALAHTRCVTTKTVFPPSQPRAARALMNDGKGCLLCGALVHELSLPIFGGKRIVLCPAVPPNVIWFVPENHWVELSGDAIPIDRRADSSRLEFPEYTSDEDFFDAAGREDLT